MIPARRSGVTAPALVWRARLRWQEPSVTEILDLPRIRRIVVRLLLVCSGGAIGSGARYLLSAYIAERFGAAFPRGTLLINATGSFGIALVMVLSLEAGVIPAETRIFLTTGVMGGYTTYSSFNYETLKLAGQGTLSLAALYLSATVLGCLVAGFLGLVAGRALMRIGATLGRGG